MKHTHYSENFRLFQEVIPFAVEDQKTFKTTCERQVPTTQFSDSPTCPDCIKILQWQKGMVEALKKFREQGGDTK